MSIYISVAVDGWREYPINFSLIEIFKLKYLKSILLNSSYSPIEFKDGRRSKENATAVHLIIFDVDKDQTIDEVAKNLRENNLRALLSTTKSHTPDHHRFRVILKPSRVLKQDELPYYKYFMKAIADDLQINGDISAYDLGRMYKPNPKAEFIFVDGDELNVDMYLERAKEQAEKEQEQMREKREYYSSRKENTDFWVYVDVQKLINSVNIEQLINHFERVIDRKKVGSRIYLKTASGNKYDIFENTCYEFHSGRGFGVINYLSHQLNSDNLHTIEKYLRENHLLNDDVISFNKEILKEKLAPCLANALTINAVIDNIKREFNVKTAYIDFKNHLIKIGAFSIQDQEIVEMIKTKLADNQKQISFHM